MAEVGYATLPRGLRIPPNPSATTSGHLSNGHIPNGHLNNHHHHLQHQHTCLSPPQIPLGGIGSNGLSNGSIPTNGCSGGRSVHDGFATIRSGGSKRGRARSSPSVNAEPRSNNNNNPCHHACCPTIGRTWGMEPLWEEKGTVEPAGVPPVPRRDRQQLPWWEIATRRSRYRSCPAFSQASVVNALEQTMSNVTNRLERLASSPDLKESEAAELRKTAAVLRQQSSAMCQSVSSGYFTMERQLSCDSVSSVTSTVSGASMSSFASMGTRPISATLPQHFNHNHYQQADNLSAADNAKIKKRSWLRSSFRRAFGRHGRKRSKQIGEGNPEDAQELPMHHAVNSAVKHLSPPPPPVHTMAVKPHHHPIIRSSHKEISKPMQKTQVKEQSQSKTEESSLVTRLRQEVAEKERELTDCRLEVLSAQHQMQSQTDAIAKLQAEVTGLREENARLLSLLRGQCGSTAADALLTPLSHTLTALTLSTGNITGNNLALVSGRQVKVMVVENSNLTSINSAALINVNPNSLTHIGNINVESKTTWEEFDKLIANTLKDYGNRIDPVSALGLESDSILCYCVDDVVRAPELPLPELLPYGYCVGCVDALHVWLKGGNHKKDGETIGDVSQASFSSVTPASSLKRLASQLTEHRRLVLAGPPASGKSFLAQTLAQFFITNSGGEYSDNAVKIFKVTGSNSLELCQMLSSMWPRGLASSSRSTSSVSSNISVSSASSVSSNNASPEIEPTPPLVIIIDDLHAAGGVVETLQRCLPTSVHIGPAIIATSCPTAALATRLHINCNFKWAALTTQQEPVRGLLGRVLRRKVVSAEVAANTRLPDAHHLAEWLTRLWLHLNTLLSGHCSSHEVGVGPGLLMDCPLGQEETQVWFTEVWNTRLVPYIKETIRTSSSPNTNIFDTWTDPLDWVLATYPWPVNAACGPDQLSRLTASDISQQEGGLITRNLSPRHPYVPLSVRQQIRKAENIYSSPQLLSLGSARGGAHGTGQTVFTSKDVKTVTIQPTLSSNNESIDSVKIDHNPSNKVDNICNVHNAHNNLIPVKGIVQNEINDFQVESKTNHIDVCNGDVKMTLIKESTDIVSSPDLLTEINQIYKSSVFSNPIGDDKNIYNSRPSSIVLSEVNEKQDVKDIVDEFMTSDNNTGNQNNIAPYLNNGNANTYINSTLDSNGVPMDMECKSEIVETNPKNLDILAKNVINSHGLASECVKIIRDAGPKIDLRDISHELTSTFKPSETAI